MCAVFWHPLGSIRVGLEPGTFPSQEMKGRHSLLSLSPCVGVVFLFQPQWMLFVSEACASYSTQPTPLFHLSCEERTVFPLWRKKCVNRWISLCGLQAETPQLWETNTYYWSSSCSVSSLSKAMFYPMLNCIVFSLVTPIPRCNRQKVFRSLRGGTGAQRVYYVFIIFLFLGIFINDSSSPSSEVSLSTVSVTHGPKGDDMLSDIYSSQ